MTESEHHSHRSDQEWRALVRGWIGDLKEAIPKNDVSALSWLAVNMVIGKMERESK